MSISVLAISLDAHNAAQLAQFWTQALHRTVNDSATEDFASIAADTDSQLGPLLMFHKVPEGKTVMARSPKPMEGHNEPIPRRVRLPESVFRHRCDAVL
ncbi:MAG: hypothetical protein QOG79_7135 [Mycobacterium sp.]|jgi:hypothetical protein|nr:hypothetical protein [Mycobacterium sp.]